MRMAPWLLSSGVASMWALSAFSCNKPLREGTNLTVTFSAITAVTVGTGGTDVTTSDVGGMGGIGGAGIGGAGIGGAGIGGAGTGGMGTGGMGTGGMGTSVTSGAGGADPVPVETPVHGCFFKDAYDLTGGGLTVNLAFSAGTKKFTATVGGNGVELPYPMCVKIKYNQKLVLGGSGVKGDPLMVSGLIDGDGVATYDKKGPMQPTCFSAATSFDPNNVPGCYQGGTWPCGGVGAPTAGQCTLDAQKSFALKAYPFYDNSQKEIRRGALYIIP